MSSFQTTPAKSSRVAKPAQRKKHSLFRRNNASPLSKPTKDTPRRKTSAAADDDALDEPLDDTGMAASLAIDLELRDVPQFVKNIQSRMFSAVPERASGMNGQRTAEVLNFRIRLPPVASVAHVHALSRSPTVTEREIAELVRKAVIRRVLVPGLGSGGAAVGEGLVLMSDWERIVRNHPDLDDELKEKYIALLHEHPTSLAISAALLSKQEAAALLNAGLLTSANTAVQAGLFSRPDPAVLNASMSVIESSSKAASGSVEAVGGSGTYAAGGGSGGGVMTQLKVKAKDSSYSFSVPSMGPYLKLLTAARAHLLHILNKTSKYREAPMSHLKERWDGGVAGEDIATQARKARGDFAGILPGRTKKWRTFYGLNFEWVLEECAGSGLVELFQTRSVGVGVRAT
ncbi:serine-threonine protein kinase 19-domain-containing protein [Phyllosticta citribraziliensis]|uniref:Serine-threonine protein kinase 19-domain-containing protein n=1 Tax=Phyllosticta citribraziliensis TaxID=989973 RepID=A0ABR1M4N9_9PEZI